MSDHAADAAHPTVKLSARYVFTDDAIADAMQLVTALTQLGQAERVKDAIASVTQAKRELATDRWTARAEAQFWGAFGRLSHAARECGILSGPVPEPVHATGFLPAVRKLVTFPGAVIVALSLVLMCGWLWAKTLAETIDNDRALLRGCLVPGSEQAAVADAFPAKPATGATAIDAATILAGCAPILTALEGRLARAQLVVGTFYVLSGDRGRGAQSPQCAPGAMGTEAIACLWLFGYNSPIGDALGKIVQAFSIFILPPLLGALGAWAFCMRQMVRSASADTSRSRLGDRRHWLNMMFGAMLGSAFALWTAEKSGVPQMFASLPPLIAAFLAGYGRDFIFAWMDEVLSRARGARGGAPAAADPAPEPAADRAEAQPPEPRLKPAGRVVGAG